MAYVPANPRIFPKCENCKKSKNGCPYGSLEDRIKGNLLTTCCSDWESKHPVLFNALAWLDLQEENLRFRIINLLDKLDRWCWADLVMWAERYRSFSEVGRIGGCLDHGDYPYCGKCEKFLPHEGQCKNLDHPVWSPEKRMWVEDTLITAYVPEEVL